MSPVGNGIVSGKRQNISIEKGGLFRFTLLVIFYTLGPICMESLNSPTPINLSRICGFCAKFDTFSYIIVGFRHFFYSVRTCGALGSCTVKHWSKTKDKKVPSDPHIFFQFGLVGFP